MKLVKNLLLVATAFFFLCGIALASENAAAPKTYKDIPGITEQEIKAVESILKNKKSFSYGTTTISKYLKQKDGSVGGYNALLCQRLSELFGLPFVANSYNWDILIANLANYKLDFTGDINSVPARERKYFMTDAVDNRFIRIFFNKNRKNIREIAKIRPLNIAFIEDNYVYDLVKDNISLPYKAVMLKNDPSAILLLKSGKIDAFIEDGSPVSFDSYDFIGSEKLYPEIKIGHSLATANPELEPIIAVIQKYLQNGGSEELLAMQAEATESYYKTRLLARLTKEEKKYLSLHSTDETAIPLCAETDNYPLSFYNAKEDKFQGYAHDILAEISTISGLKIKIATAKNTSWPDMLESLKSGHCAMVTSLLKDKEREKWFIWADKAYSKDHYAFLSLEDFKELNISDIESYKIGLLEYADYAENFKRIFPKATNIKTFSNIEAIVAALEKKEIDLAISTENCAQSFENAKEKNNFKINLILPESLNSHFGFNKNEKMLRSIINKSQDYIDSTEIINNWKSKKIN